ncbi:MAG: alkaline phosphatase D family protein [Sulfurimonas sp.]|nr:alkaline phosphatase D family protein [Sulfurimonas sp.]
MNFSTRREFLKISALSACALMISTGLSGCGGDDNSNNEADSSSFNHGIASGDPLSDKVIIWTRVTSTAPSVNVTYEVATDESFTNIIHNGTYTTDSTKDFTVKIDIQNLTSGTLYYYRFSSFGTTSTVGKMKTLSEGLLDTLKMAVFSCANYTNGYFNPYTEASKLTDLDVTLHLGDYIYEYGKYKDDDYDAKIPSYATSNAQTIGREFPADNEKECIALDDYRKRYALYHTDRGLQALHAAAPMIAVWDDHEVANDTYKDGAQNHDDTEGDFQARVDAALQAYFEWLPIRPIDNKKEIFRTFNFGDLVSLNMLETRIFGRDKQLDYGDFYTANGDFLATDFTAAIGDTNRTMMGISQLAWLQGEMASSTATWQVLGQQVLMGRMNLPAEILTPIGQLENPEAYGTTTEELLLQINTSLGELAQIKGRFLQGDSTLTGTEIARISTVLPYNLDAWDGYYVERETILGTAKALNKNLVVLAGDTHNSWANNLKDMNGNSIGVEFATTSVSSPGMEDYLSLADDNAAAQLEGALSLLIDDLQYTNLSNRGFMEVIYTKTEVRSNWHYVVDNDSSDYTLNSLRSKSLKSSIGTKELEAIL